MSEVATATPLQGVVDAQSIRDQVFGGAAKNVFTKEAPAAPAAPAPTNNSSTSSIQAPTTAPEAEAGTAGPSTTAPATAAPAGDDGVVDINTFLKNEFGYDSLEVAKTDWQALRKLKETPPPPAEPLINDPVSKKIYENLKAGKIDEVHSFLSAQQVLKGVEAKTADDQLKLFIKLQNPLFNDEEVNEEFNEKYNVDDEGIEPAKLSRERKKAEQQKKKDLQEATTFFSQYKTKFELPDVAPPAPAGEMEALTEFQALVKKEQESQQKLEERLAKVAETNIGYKGKFADEKSKLAFDLNFQFDAASIQKAKTGCADWFTYLKENYYDEAGNPQTEKWLTHIAILQNLDKFVTGIASDAVNADRRWFLANQKNINTGGQRENVNYAPSDVDRLREAVFSKG